MSKRRVLAISSDLDQLRRLVAALERAGAVVDAVRSVEAIAGGAIAHRAVVLAGAGPTLAASLAALAPRLREQAQVAVLAPAATVEELAALVARDLVAHAVVGDDVEGAVFVAAQKLLTGDIFGIEKHLPPGTPVQYARLRDDAGAAQARAALEAFAAEAGAPPLVRTALGEACAALVGNALYAAPVDEAGRPVFADPRAAAAAGLATPAPVSVRYAATPAQLAIAVRDRYGRLTRPALVAALGDRGGLGRVAHAVTGCVVNVAPGVATEIVCTLDRDARRPLRELGLFLHPGGDGEVATTGRVPRARTEPAEHRDG